MIGGDQKREKKTRTTSDYLAVIDRHRGKEEDLKKKKKGRRLTVVMIVGKAQKVDKRLKVEGVLGRYI